MESSAPGEQPWIQCFTQHQDGAEREKGHTTPYLPLVGILHLLPWALWVLRPRAALILCL